MHPDCTKICTKEWLGKMATIVEHGAGYRVQIRRQGHQSVSKSGFATKAEAKAWARSAEAAMDKGQRVEPGRVTFEAILDAYIGATASKVAGRSKSASLIMLRRKLGALKLAQITSTAILRFVAEREAEGAGPTTIGMDLSYIGTALRHGCAAHAPRLDGSQALAELAAARGVLAHADRVAKSAERDRRPTDAELLALISYLRANPCDLIPLVDLILFAGATGMRLSEITRLDRRELNKTNRTIWIRNRKHPKQKAGNDQCVPLLAGPFVLNGHVIDPMEIIARQKSIGLVIFPYQPASVSAAFTRTVARCGIDDLHFHDLRHHACSLLFEAGYQIEQVALVSGHRDWNMLRRYTKLKPETLHRPLAGNVVPLHGASAQAQA